MKIRRSVRIYRRVLLSRIDMCLSAMHLVVISSVTVQRIFTVAAVYRTCEDIRLKRAKYNPNRNDVYAVDPDQSGGFDIFGARCDYTTDKSMGISVVSRFSFDYTTVKIGKHYSQSGLPNGGVPQGTLSGPKCFLVYINDLETPVHLYKYVDDSTLFEVCERNGVSLMQESVDIASKWTEENYMKLNNEKSKEMIISFAKNGNFRHTIPNIKIDGIDVEQVDHAKLLGVTISHDLSWNKHVDYIVKKAGKRLYMMYQLKRAGISQSDLVTVYLSVVRPVLEHACPVWHTNLQQYLSDNIETIQKRALICIFRGASYAEILSNVGLQTLKDRRDCICKKYFNSMKSETHKLHHLLPDERHVNYEMRQVNYIHCQKHVPTDIVTLLYHGGYVIANEH